MVSPEKFRKTEGLLFRHYRNIKRKDRLEFKRALLEKRIESIRLDIRECNVEISEGLGGMDYSRDRVSCSSDNCGHAERQLIQGIEKLENELKHSRRERLKLNQRIRTLSEQIAEIDYMLNMLDEESRRIIDCRYGEEYNIRQIAEVCCMAETTVRRKRKDIIADVAKYIELS